MAAKMSRTDSVATPAAVREKAVVTHPPTSMGIATMSCVGVVSCVVLPFAMVEYVNDADTVPLLPPVKLADRVIMKYVLLSAFRSDVVDRS